LSKTPTIYWYDLETFGIDPKHARIAQFAGVRTDAKLNMIEDPLTLYCKPTPDFLPDPQSCLVTGITPQLAQRKGLNEAEFIARIHDQFSRPGTCVAGYNNIRFDDEFIRYSLYRNLFDPYAREWQNGNSRWDILDMVRLTRALRPDGIQWPQHENGVASFKLEDLTKANGLSHEAAHDALSDVYATIAVAKLIRERQPKLFDFVFQHRSKQAMLALLNANAQKPLVHVSGMYPAERGCTAMIFPVATHPFNRNALIAYDLSFDPAPVLELSSEEIKERLFTATAELPDGIERIPLKQVHINKCPIIVPANTLDPASAERLQIDREKCQANLQVLLGAQGLAEKVQAVFADRPEFANDDPDWNLYGGFFSDTDKRKMEKLREMAPKQLAASDWVFEDKRLPEMVFRYRARNYPQTLTQEEQVRWEEFRCGRLMDSTAGVPYAQYLKELQELTADTALHESQRAIIDNLIEYAKAISPHNSSATYNRA
jgi:exodeoxyribonuclease-1